jgi:hypothetical protein
MAISTSRGGQYGDNYHGPVSARNVAGHDIGSINVKDFIPEGTASIVAESIPASHSTDEPVERMGSWKNVKGMRSCHSFSITIRVVLYFAASMRPLLNILLRKGKDRATDQGSTASTSTDPHPVGLEVVSEGTAPIVAESVLASHSTHEPVEQIYVCSVVFVHGLRGHRRVTWTKDGVFWPEALLSKEPSLSHMRILSFGYDANVVKFMGRASLNNLFDHTSNLLNDLTRKRRDSVSLKSSQCSVLIRMNSWIVLLFLLHTLSVGWL